MTNLSALIVGKPALSPAAQVVVQENLQQRRVQLANTDWRSWNWSRARATSLLAH